MMLLAVMLTDRRAFEIRRALLGALALISLAGCASGESAPASGPASVDKRREVIERETTVRTPTRGPEKDEANNPGEVPVAIRNLFVDDLMLRALVRREAITIVAAQALTWPDGSLGCAAPGMNYMQVVTPGYRVKLTANGQTYSYHSDGKGRFVLCDQGAPAAPAKRTVGDKPPAS